MRKYTVDDLVKTKRDFSFVGKLIEQAHADPEIKRILKLNNETVDETKYRVLASNKFSKI